jgi:hypothetical protein
MIESAPSVNAMGRKKKTEWEMPDEVRIVLECSRNLMPCKKFLHANIYRFADHMKNDKCQQCIAFFRQAEKELKTMRLLAAWRKSRNN